MTTATPGPALKAVRMNCDSGLNISRIGHKKKRRGRCAQNGVFLMPVNGLVAF